MAITRPTSDEIHTAINTAARRMTATASSPDLRARVLSRIAVAPPRWDWRLAIAGGAAASVVILVATQLVSPKPEAPAIVAVAPPMAKADPTVAPIASSPVLSAASMTRTAPRRVTVAVSAAEMEWRARAVQALALPDALQVEPLEHPRLSIDPMDITPLSVAPLTVPALGSGTSGK